jgi:hypothetical protein
MAGYITLAEINNYPFPHVQCNDLIIYGKEGVSNIVFGIQGQSASTMVITNSRTILNQDMMVRGELATSNITSYTLNSSNITSYALNSSNVTTSHAVIQDANISTLTCSHVATSNINTSNHLSSNIISSNVVCTTQLTASNIFSYAIESDIIKVKNMVSTENVILPIIFSSNISCSNISVRDVSCSNIKLENVSIHYDDLLRFTRADGITSNIIAVETETPSGFMYYASNVMSTTTTTRNILYDEITGDVPWFVSTDGNVIFNNSLGNIGIGFSNPTVKLAINGSILSSDEITTFSDRRLKTDIEPITDSIVKIKKMTGYTFQMKGGSTKRRMGLIAQEVNEVVPEVVFHDQNGIMSVAYGNITALLLEALKAIEVRLQNVEQYIQLKND